MTETLSVPDFDVYPVRQALSGARILEGSRSPVRTWTLVSGVLAVLLAGCTSSDEPASATPRPASADQPPPLVPVVIGATDRRTDSFVLNSASVSSHVLTLSVSYSGGCRKHEFVLTAGAFVESGPIQLDLVLTHDANGDTCEAFPTEQLRYDLTPIRERYRGAYGRDSGTVHLRLDQSPAPLVYRF